MADLSLNSLPMHYFGADGNFDCPAVAQQENAPAGCSKRPFSKAAGESKPEAYPQGYVEDFGEPRTKLAGFFSILLAAKGAFGCSQLAFNGCADRGQSLRRRGFKP